MKSRLVSRRDITDIRTDLNEVRPIGIVFQAYNLFPHKTASQNIIMAWSASGSFQRARRASGR